MIVDIFLLAVKYLNLVLRLLRLMHKLNLLQLSN